MVFFLAVCACGMITTILEFRNCNREKNLHFPVAIASFAFAILCASFWHGNIFPHPGTGTQQLHKGHWCFRQGA